MKIAMIIVRTLVGLLLLFASVAYFFNFGKPTTPMPDDVIAYNKGLALVHIMTVVKVIELICGLLFVTGRYVTLAVIVLFPIAINIVLFHAVLMPSSIGGGAFVLLGDLFLAYYYRRNYASLFAK